MGMDKNELALIITVNGFEIRKNDRSMTTEPYRVFHANCEGTYITDFPTLKDAEQFCKTEDADEWVTKILKL